MIYVSKSGTLAHRDAKFRMFFYTFLHYCMEAKRRRKTTDEKAKAESPPASISGSLNGLIVRLCRNFLAYYSIDYKRSNEKQLLYRPLYSCLQPKPSQIGLYLSIVIINTFCCSRRVNEANDLDELLLHFHCSADYRAVFTF